MAEHFDTFLQHMSNGEEMRSYEIDKGFLFENGKKVVVRIGGKLFDLFYYCEAKSINPEDYEIKEICRTRPRTRKFHRK